MLASRVQCAVTGRACADGVCGRVCEWWCVCMVVYGWWTDGGRIGCVVVYVLLVSIAGTHCQSIVRADRVKTVGITGTRRTVC